ncbi:uncharacterized protein LOC108158275 [Drosophila miranda]|uniref:uncharacterized protein LOC108158275 n=1 Tax=Drosophila miranda TaxID=7229 RepID=UPI0007E8154E|nr:uncharacterized protein LOC108158275 [Drosophila miranda]
MCHRRLHILLLLLCLFSFALLSVNGLPWGGPSSNHHAASGGPAWNGGNEEDPRNIVLHANGNGKAHYGSQGTILHKWRY